MMRLTIAALAVASCSAKTYFKEDFSGSWADRWSVSQWKKDGFGALGAFVQTAGKNHADEKDMGVQTSEDAKFYAMATKMTENFNNEGKDLFLQYSVKHEQDLDCGGAYIKLAPPATDVANFGGDADYNIMFGPDQCGSTKRVHAIITYKGKNFLIKKEISPKNDKLSHLYEFAIKKDQTFTVKIDGVEEASGNLIDQWDFLPAKEIQDPATSKPADWVDEQKIADPEDKKPDGWDDIPKQNKDPKAEKPEDWDDEEDGEWEAPMIDNPEYKGEWSAKMIDNPAYKGEWVHPMVANPEYAMDEKIYVQDMGAVGFELWQVKSGTIFDDILVTDSADEADAALALFKTKAEGEKKMFDAAEEKKKAEEEEARKKEEAEKKDEPEEEEEDDEEEDDKKKDEL